MTHRSFKVNLLSHNIKKTCPILTAEIDARAIFGALLSWSQVGLKQWRQTPLKRYLSAFTSLLAIRDFKFNMFN